MKIRINLRRGILVNFRRVVWLGILTVFGNSFAEAPRNTPLSLFLLAAGAALTYCMVTYWSPRLR